MKCVHIIPEASESDYTDEQGRTRGRGPREELMLKFMSKGSVEVEFLLFWESLVFFSQGLQLI